MGAPVRYGDAGGNGFVDATVDFRCALCVLWFSCLGKKCRGSGRTALKYSALKQSVGKEQVNGTGHGRVDGAFLS